MFSRLAVRAVRPRGGARRAFSQLSQRLNELVPVKREEIIDVGKKYGDKVLGEHTVKQAIGGMRGITSMVWEPSLLDAEEGIRYRGLTIEECQEQLPRAHGSAEPGRQPLPEALLWLLLTGEVPTAEQTADLAQDLRRRCLETPDSVLEALHFPQGMHPMTAFSQGVLTLQTQSEFASAYRQGINKMDAWKPQLEDCLNLIARVPRVAAAVYHSSRGSTFDDPAWEEEWDWSVYYNRLLGFGPNGTLEGAGDEFDELMRLYMVVHADHEGGNVSAHATHLVGSALSDPYLSFSAGLNGLAGPLHGLANQEVLRWITQFKEDIEASGAGVNAESVVKQAWNVLNQGKVIPGFGHAVLRKTDPRYTAQRAFAKQYMPDDPNFHLVSLMYETIPGVLTEHGKTQNPWPNVDAHSGILLTRYGLTDMNYYTVLFGVSRALGVCSQLFWDRALGLPIERPKSITLEAIRKQFEE